MTASHELSILPPLTPEEAAHSAALAALIRSRIADAGGWIDFETFMDLALYAPGLGYYSAGSVKLGPGGDFVTAPEVSDLFSRCVARQCAELLARTGGEILEFGAGTGRMAAVILDELASLDVFPERYSILEVSADLRARQEERIAQLPRHLRERVRWLDRLPDAPITGLMLANEVLDALPVRRFVLRDGGIRELGVALAEDGSFVERESDASETLRAECESLFTQLPEPLPDGYRSELCLRTGPWVATVAERLGHGALLLFDYGLPRAHYYHPQRTTGTLRCHFRQRVHDDPLANVGVQDITAWVDFTRVAEAALESGLDVAGFATQAAFLLATGIDTLAAARSTDLREQVKVAGEARRLLLPGEMGEAFKVMALVRGLDEPLGGFALQDLRDSL
ncbi:class I SAM-dependent methyltransferase [Caldimonas thermodepolymerans]|jgi:Uncharacterized conserved protein|uniref:class I SAM-dependent methyltransferase n=1 Tax=Caldimonas thermodepolymerans TaxID=215580 RepID=UPI000DB7C63F|nr:SAM-dependent methyltransferase [Caldimonas thermodepolymerans]PZN77853.1 MAG: SAM-dependent methyltransferase [Pseudomonadota bacterium]